MDSKLKAEAFIALCETRPRWYIPYPGEDDLCNFDTEQAQNVLPLATVQGVSASLDLSSDGDTFISIQNNVVDTEEAVP